MQFFYMLYMCKQTFVATDYNLTIIILMGISIGLVIVMNYNSLYSKIVDIKYDILLFIISMLLCSILFKDVIDAIIVISKCAVIFIIGVLTIKSGRHILIMMADLSSLFLVTMGLLVFSGVLETNLISNEVWVKNDLGFINPNIGPYFAASSLFIYFITGKKIRFNCFLILVFFAYAFFSIYSRTYNIGILLLFIYMVLSLNQGKYRFIINWFSSFILFFIMMYLILVSLIVVGLVNINGWIGFIDYIISARLTKIYDINFYISEEGSIFKLNPIDSIIYELIFIFGPYTTYIFFSKLIRLVKIFYFRSGDTINSYALLVFILMGVFEGLFAKFSPMTVAVAILIFINKDQIKSRIFYK